ncbi:MAG: HAMP domain-containing sensor histidine kinase [Candidatus Pacebacteria bacterium]|nr:HAMP domain-containing sensor histidine kinase [Candidatus Paceibacterota bacterium]
MIERKNSEFLIIVVFTLVIVYGYFFNKSTDKLIQANFNEREAKELLEDFNKTLQQKVDEQTKEIRQQKEEVEKAYEVEKKGRRLEEKARKDLQRLDEAKSQFMLATQHHLRTPLTSMYGYLDLLLTGSYGKISQKVKEILGKFQKSTKNEIKIVEELLNISKIQLGEDVVFLQPDVDIESILNEIIEDLKPEAEQKGIYLKMEKPGKLPKIKADQSKLKMALSNIIDNAVKYTEKGGVLIKLETTDSQLRVITKDTGIGIDKEEAENLFTRIFERSKTAQKMFTTGRGIGLFISAKIIEGHKGKAWAESEGLGKGSTFFVELPIG